ncbi:MAG: 2-amino-4-hydroxy-6-hydroxymethyldihydropteridine diphosphokinase [Pseudonocardiaceae bacterium]|nr:2-amino-4-hydroxy-6-hydroxymethyldihydropteridine diphosphokinase [Pseudonocardiaceae bacterium]
MTRAVLSIGSNLGDRLDYLRLAVDEFGASVEAVSPVYETAPWGVTDQPEFLNAVLIVNHPEVDAWGWLRAGQRREQTAQRVREQHWGPRSLDVDVITVDGATSEDDELRLPHPHAHRRAFVLAPWLDLDTDAELPGHGKVAELLDALPADERSGVRRRDDLSLP